MIGPTVPVGFCICSRERRGFNLRAARIPGETPFSGSHNKRAILQTHRIEYEKYHLLLQSKENNEVEREVVSSTPYISALPLRRIYKLRTGARRRCKHCSPAGCPTAERSMGAGQTALEWRQTATQGVGAAKQARGWI